MIRTTTFNALNIGDQFTMNGNRCEKRSSRTAFLFEAARTFYVQPNVRVRRHVEVKTVSDWKDVPAAYKDTNPKLDFFGHDGAYLYSSNFYRCVVHAWAHVTRNPITGYSMVAKIERSER